MIHHSTSLNIVVGISTSISIIGDMVGEYMRFRGRVSTWHGSYTVTIPKALGDEMGLERGEPLELLMRRLPMEGPVMIKEEDA